MSRVVFLVAIAATCGVAQAQDDGGGNAGGADTGGANTGGDGDTVGGTLGTTEIAEQGVQTGPVEQTESGFLSETAFGGPVPGEGFQTRTFGGAGAQNPPVVIGGSSQTQRQVRPTFRLGFVPSAAMLARSRQRAVSRWVTITPRATGLSGMSFNPDQNGRVTVRGQATTRYDSLLAAAIARLEPGVRSVRNEVRVVPNAGAATRSQLQQPTVPQLGQPQFGFPQPQPAVPSRALPPAPSNQTPSNPLPPVVPNRTPVQNQAPSTAPIVLPLPPLAPGR